MKDDPINACPDCGQQVKRIIGKNINVIYRTTGFYSTDNSPACPSDSSGEGCAHCEHFEAHKHS
jgi:predicted nucleic acid-binding Zn ribbon protein